MASDYQRMFDETLHLTRDWIEDLAQRLLVDDPHTAYMALRVVLHALRDRLPPPEAVHLSAQLPMLVRGFYFDGWNPSRTPSPERQAEEFLAHIRDSMADPSVRPEAAAHCVFGLLNDRLSKGQVDKVQHLLPVHIRALWPHPGEAA